MLVSYLMYFAVNTVPTIAYAVSCLAKYMTMATPQHYVYARQVLRYLKGVQPRKLTWCAKFVIRLNEASFDLMLTQMTNLLARAQNPISSFATMQLFVGNPSLLLFSRFQLPKLN